MQVIADAGLPGTENEEDYPVGSQVSDVELASRM